MTHGAVERLIRASLAVACAAPIALIAPPADAHGGVARAFGIVFEPGSPSDVILRSDLWGFFRSLDGGKTWFWGCAELYKESSFNANHNNIAIAVGGRILVASVFDGLRISDDGCNWRAVPTFESQLVFDVQA